MSAALAVLGLAGGLLIALVGWWRSGRRMARAELLSEQAAELARDGERRRIADEWARAHERVAAADVAAEKGAANAVDDHDLAAHLRQLSDD